MSKFLKVIAYLLLTICCLFGSPIAISYLTAWKVGDPVENVPYICYVAVENESQFIRFKEFMETPTQAKISTKQMAKKEGYENWQLTTEKQIKTVHYWSDEYESWFRYRVNNQQVEPLYCRGMGIGTGLVAGLLTMLLLVSIPFIKIFVNIYRRFRSRKMS